MMFELTDQDGKKLDTFIADRKAYPDAIYDFTFEGRYLIYHIPIGGVLSLHRTGHGYRLQFGSGTVQETR